MSIVWSEYKAFFYCEFVDSEGFPESKKDNMQNYCGDLYIVNDFTIYLLKSHPKNTFNETDYNSSFSRFNIILFDLPTFKVEDFIDYHYDRFEGDKLVFVKYLFDQYNGSTYNRGVKEIPPPVQHDILIDWCNQKLNGFQYQLGENVNEMTFVNLSRVEELEKVNNTDFDLTKVIQLCKEMNDNYYQGNYISLCALLRVFIDHIPPVFEFQNFTQLVNNYQGKSFKSNMKSLEDNLKTASNICFHSQVSKKVTLPNVQQVNFSSNLDVLLCEIIKVLS